MLSDKCSGVNSKVVFLKCNAVDELGDTISKSKCTLIKYLSKMYLIYFQTITVATSCDCVRL